jgi:hypothetical protein
MRYWIFAIMLVSLTSAALADEATSTPPSSVGGGATNPWRPPFRTALILPPGHTLLHP